MYKHICRLTLVFTCIYRKVSDEHWDFEKCCYSVLFSNGSVAKSSNWVVPFLGLRWQHLFYLHDLCVQLLTANTNMIHSPSLFSGHVVNLLHCLQKAYEQLELNEIWWHTLNLTEDQDGKVKVHSTCTTILSKLHIISKHCCQTS